MEEFQGHLYPLSLSFLDWFTLGVFLTASARETVVMFPWFRRLTCKVITFLFCCLFQRLYIILFCENLIKSSLTTALEFIDIFFTPLSNISLLYHLLVWIMSGIDYYYHPASAPCRSILSVGKELGINFNLKLTNLMNKEHLTPEYLAVSHTFFIVRQLHPWQWLYFLL